MPWLVFRNRKIFYRLEGRGKPVMLLHGFGEDGRVWEGQLEKLKKKFLVIVPDLPGSGQSELLEGECSLEDYANVIKEIAETEIMGRMGENTFSLIGHSMGGYISLVFAEKYGDLLNSLGLFHSSAFADSPEKVASRKKSIGFIKEKGAEIFSKTTVPDLFAAETRDTSPQLVDRFVGMACALSAPTLIQYTRAMIKRKDTTDVLRSLTCPVLFIIGVHDKAVPLDVSLAQCHLPAKNSVHFLRHSGHLGMLEEKELSNVYLMNFLNGYVYRH